MVTLVFLAFILGVTSLIFSNPLTVFAAGPVPVNLLSTSNFVILSKTGITDTGSHTSMITGNIGSSPITAAAVSNVFCSEITGKIYGVDAAYVGSGDQTCFLGNPPASNKTLVDNAVLDMGTAYADASGRTLPDGTELYAGNIGGRTFTPGLYKWSSDVTIPTDVTLSGGPNDVWIFQVAGNLSIASGGSVPSGVKVLLIGGAKASNIFWQVGGVTGATLGTYSTFNGNILTAKAININTGAVLNGRALAQSEVTLDANPVSIPVSSATGDLVVTSISTINANATADGIFAHGWKYIFNITVPTNESHLSMKFADWKATNGLATIAVANNMRISSAQADNGGATVLITAPDSYSIPTLNMTGDLNGAEEGRQVQVMVETEIPLNTTDGPYTTSYGVQSQL
jgi:hypothetical protein